MEIKSLTPPKGNGVYRLDDSDDLVLTENVRILTRAGVLPEDKAYIENHAVIIICTEGTAQFKCDGKTIQLRKNDMFLYIKLRSVVSDIISSQNYRNRQIWFTPREAWGMDMHGSKIVGDLIYLKQHPQVRLNNKDAEMLNDYFRLLRQRMSRPCLTSLQKDIARSLWGAMLMEILCILRSETVKDTEQEQPVGTSRGIHRKRLADKFVHLVEQSDGHIRRVDDYAKQLNVTAKYLSGVIKDTMNRRPIDLIRLFTLKAIERRLRFSDMTMQEIAYDLNFVNASHFGRYVKESLGMSPLEYRKKYQQ